MTPRSLPTLLLAGVTLLVAGLLATTFVVSGQEQGELKEAAVTPGPPDGYAPVEIGEPAPTLPAVSSNDCVDLRQVQEIKSGADLDSYVQAKRSDLVGLGKDGISALPAGLNFNRLVGWGELRELLEVRSLTWVNVYWEASNGVHGAISAESGPFTLDEMASELLALGEIDAGDEIWAYYVSVRDASPGTLMEIQQDERILLVDVGHYAQFVEAYDSGGCAKFALPDPLWYTTKELGRTAR